MPSGVVVSSQDSSSQHRNREVAFERLVERLERLGHAPLASLPPVGRAVRATSRMIQIDSKAQCSRSRPGT